MSELANDSAGARVSRLRRYADPARIALCALGLAGLASAFLGSNILPAPREPTRAGEGKRSELAPKAAPDYVPVGAGLTDRACVHRVPEGAVVDASHSANGGEIVVTKDGRTIARYSSCEQPRISALTESGTDAFPPQVVNTTW